ncbi:alternative ribosome rescue aminoacyl-tRNA hydrolase ArfB [Subtercola endophyticus]|uniref:alternative ribosome rescue aminoacyl-tRNA hydrolase ArfB n=1 Tax=Subtercola endophyticus TaxID=2895559 RepID=UPI001E513243|nr:alternative ribosome rescue aminoacyl-tRNA hydrolase ArfB [Subtercola endophyticus]UFS60417.1 aminoacyl-tRNA hydrolase [Subtercola endophyticus]
MDLVVSPALTIPSSELGWRFSRSSGAGGQHVNTSDSRVELFWDVVGSAALSESQRTIILSRLAKRLVGGSVVVTASERRSQLRNRETALTRLSDLVATALAPDAAPRRPTKATRGSKLRRLAAKEQRSETKKQRQRPSDD